jgi:hypothetical protein
LPPGVRLNGEALEAQVQTAGRCFRLIGIVLAMLLLSVPLALVSFTVIPLVLLATLFQFGGTVANNIAYGRPGASPAQIRAA